MAEALRQEDQATRAMMFHEIKTYEQKHNENMAKSNPFKTKMAQTNLSKSKKAWVWLYINIYTHIIFRFILLTN